MPPFKYPTTPDRRTKHAHTCEVCGAVRMTATRSEAVYARRTCYDCHNAAQARSLSRLLGLPHDPTIRLKRRSG